MTGHHDAVLAELAEIRAHAQVLLERVTEIARSITAVEDKVDEIAAAVAAEQVADASMRRVLDDLRGQTGTLAFRRRDSL